MMAKMKSSPNMRFQGDLIMSEKAGHIHPCLSLGTGHNSGYWWPRRALGHGRGNQTDAARRGERESSAAAVAARR